jgi:hypothetical protein
VLICWFQPRSHGVRRPTATTYLLYCTYLDQIPLKEATSVPIGQCRLFELTVVLTRTNRVDLWLWLVRWSEPSLLHDTRDSRLETPSSFLSSPNPNPTSLLKLSRFLPQTIQLFTLRPPPASQHLPPSSLPRFSTTTSSPIFNLQSQPNFKMLAKSTIAVALFAASYVAAQGTTANSTIDASSISATVKGEFAFNCSLLRHEKLTGYR